MPGKEFNRTASSTACRIARRIVAELWLKPRKLGGSSINDATAILADIVRYGKSGGWSGTAAQIEAVEKILKKFNVEMTDEFHGVFAVR